MKGYGAASASPFSRVSQFLSFHSSPDGRVSLFLINEYCFAESRNLFRWSCFSLCCFKESLSGCSQAPYLSNFYFSVSDWKCHTKAFNVHSEQKDSREALIERSLLGKAVSKKEWATGLFPLRATTARIYCFLREGCIPISS